MSNLDQVKPGMPWLPTRQERSQKALSFLLSVLASVVLLFTTGLNGKLGWVIAFFISYVSISFITEYRRAGIPAAQDTLYELKRKLYRAVVNVNILEGIRFYVSFDPCDKSGSCTLVSSLY